jgi:dolichol-phosphate mannosyltransferase
MTSIDFVSSAYNEEECLPELFERISAVMRSEPNYTYRIIIIDNGSQDATWKIIKSESDTNPTVVGIRMSRNFSLDSAFTCGIDYAEADIAIVMASDLQDPPEAIPLLLRKYEEGYDQVLLKYLLKRQQLF